MIFQPIVYQWFTFKNNIADKVWLACSVSIAAQVITFPLSAYYFHQFPVYFLVSNLLITIPIFVIMYSGLLLLSLPQIPYVSLALGYLLEQSILLMHKVLAFIEQSPYASIGKICLTKPEHLLLYAIIILLFYYLHDKRKWRIKATLVCTLVFSISISFKKFRADETSSVTFLNLRKHTGIVFKNGSRGVVITDLHETDKNFQYAIQPGLDSSRITVYKVYNIADAVKLPWLVKQGGLVVFENKKLLLLNDGSNIQSIPQQTGIKYLVVSNNTFLDTPMLRDRTVIINADNSNNYIEKFKENVKGISVNYKILKRNKSVSIVSNQHEY
ncbi:hypothetical protein ABIB62_002469 [Mucilaginibacter sp. UYP25]